ncbi:hypothetical protein Tco_1019659 [Tanacetum coccineum]|uniref:CCHC-type domain-containing protein n=1 Tax=Tanacetum coccineum TaxID=301880 RepID=A0ABQ5FZG4_9ASTR
MTSSSNRREAAKTTLEKDNKRYDEINGRIVTLVQLVAANAMDTYVTRDIHSRKGFWEEVFANFEKDMGGTIRGYDAIMNQKLITISERQAEQKRKIEFNTGNNQGYQQLPKRQSVAQAYAVGTGERKEYAGTLPLCNKCKFHHHGPCTVKTITCYECGNQGHYKSDCPELENRNHGNQAEGTEARGMAYALGGRETNQDLENIEDDINA